MLDVGSPSLSGLSVEGFLDLQKMLTTTKGILWIVQDNDQSSRKPEYHMIDGFSRAMSSENPQLKFVRLAPETPHHQKLYASTLILEVLERTVKTRVEELEPEYEERNGLLHVGRVTEANNLNEMLALKITSQQRQSVLLNESSPLGLCISWSGMLDSFEYHENTENLQSLPPDEVLV